MHPEFFTYTVTVLLIFLGVIWGRKDWGNVFIKLFLIFMGIYGSVLSLGYLGVVMIK